MDVAALGDVRRYGLFTPKDGDAAAAGKFNGGLLPGDEARRKRYIDLPQGIIPRHPRLSCLHGNEN